MIRNIIDARFGHLIGRLLTGFAREEFLNDTYRLIPLAVVKTRRAHNGVDGLLRVGRQNAVGKNARHVLSPFHITRFLQSSQGCGDPRLHIGHIIVPSRFAGNFQSRIRSRQPQLSQVLNRPPNLLNLFNAQLGLIQQNEMLA